MAIRWEGKTTLRAWPVYTVCALVIAMTMWGSRNRPWRRRGKGLAEAVALNIQDGPVIVAFSEEPADILTAFVETCGVRYKLVSLKGPPPEPFRAPWVRLIPTSFYIDVDGRIKLAIEGVVPFFQAKAIVKAKE
jgi:hypothetical protein